MRARFTIAMPGDRFYPPAPGACLGPPRRRVAIPRGMAGRDSGKPAYAAAAIGRGSRGTPPQPGWLSLSHGRQRDRPVPNSRSAQQHQWLDC